MFAACNLEAEVAAAVRPTLSHTEEGGSIVVQSDRLLEGIEPNGLEDSAYREAYRDCMRGRGF